MTLLDALAAVPDPRRAAGQRHPLPPVLAGVTVALLAGHRSYTAIGRFLRDHEAALRDRLPFHRHALPSHVTVWKVLTRVDSGALSAAFLTWLAHHQPGSVRAARAAAERTPSAGPARPHDGYAALVGAYGALVGADVPLPLEALARTLGLDGPSPARTIPALRRPRGRPPTARPTRLAPPLAPEPSAR